jgi:hypothetical protein
MTIHRMPQRSDEWFAIRCGKFTASDFDDLMPSSRQKMTDFNKTQMGIIYRVAAERITGTPIADGYISKAMQHGIDTEAEARIAYSMQSGEPIEEVGFLEYTDWIGASPDGLIGETKGLEIKCPNSDTHLRYLTEGFGEDYFHQVQGALWISGREEWDLISFDPRFPIERQLYIETRWLQPAAVEMMSERLEKAIAKVKEIIESNEVYKK